MQISVHVHASAEFKPAVEQIQQMERAGLDIVWVAEAYGFDAVTLMGYLAARTDRLRIGSGVLPIYSRAPTLLAQTAAGLDYLSDGRALLGIGSSNPQVIEGWYGVPYDAPVQRTREIIEVCRSVWRRETVRADGLVQIPLGPGQGTGLGKPLKIIPHPVRPEIPVFVAALGPRNVAMAAEVADGWMPLLFVPERAADVWGTALAAGRGRRAPERGPLEIVAGGTLAIGEHPDESVVAAARAQLALYLGGMGAASENYYADLARRYGYGEDVEVIQRLYSSGDKAAAMVAVPQELVERTNLIGPRGFVAERVAAMREAGVTILDVRLPAGASGPEAVAQLRDIVEG